MKVLLLLISCHRNCITALRKYYSLNTEEDGNKHTVISLGHPIGLAIKYRKSQLKKYTISLHKGHTPAMQSKSDFPSKVVRIFANKHMRE